MDPINPTIPIPPQPSTVVPDEKFTNELAHITQEMYKKNFELADKNKTLSLLRKIDEIILSKVSNTYEIAQQVVDVVAKEAGFQKIEIYTLDKVKQVLFQLASSHTQVSNKSLENIQIPLMYQANLLVQCVRTKTEQKTTHIIDMLVPTLTEPEASSLQTSMGITSSFLYPFVVRDDAIGILAIHLGKANEATFDQQKDLISRLVEVIGIALDNAMLYQQIQQANEQLKQIDKLKDEFVSLASHELRTPMTAIKSYLWMTLSGKGGELAEKQKYYLDRAYQSTDRLIKLVNNMLSTSRIESGRVMLTIKQVDLNGIISDVLAEMLPRAQELAIALQFFPDPTLPNMQADSDKIKEVLINLIGNSLKFTPPGGFIKVAAVPQNTMILVSVADTGKGISKEEEPKLFKKFATFDDEYLVKQSAQGTGLGLYISKSLIELHGGKIWVESKGQGQGTTFFFTIKQSV